MADPPHQMETPRFNQENGSSPSDPNHAAKEQYLQSIIVQHLCHAVQCRDIKCRLPKCQTMKRSVLHFKNHKGEKDCLRCRQILSLCCYHAIHCSDDENCNVLACGYIKPMHRRLINQNRIQRMRGGAPVMGDRANLQTSSNNFPEISSSTTDGGAVNQIESGDADAEGTEAAGDGGSASGGMSPSTVP